MNSEFDDIENEDLDEIGASANRHADFADNFIEEFDETSETLNRDFDESFEDELEIDESNVDIEIKELQFTNINVKTAILAKNDMYALLCLKTANEGGAICRVDPREANPAFQLYDDPAQAEDKYSRNIDTSVKNGWQVLYQGLPLHG